jgi:hypothetical protein
MALIVLDAVLIRSPNLIGKIGLWFYKYHYLRTFPKALLTVSLVIGIAAIIAEIIRYIVKKELIKGWPGSYPFFISRSFIVLLVKVVMVFQRGPTVTREYVSSLEPFYCPLLFSWYLYTLR